MLCGLASSTLSFLRALSIHLTNTLIRAMVILIMNRVREAQKNVDCVSGVLRFLYLVYWIMLFAPARPSS